MSSINTQPDSIERLKMTLTDDAKRNVSFRILTSDYGRVRYVANKLQTRDSAALRFLLHIALDKCEPLFDNAASPDSRIKLLAELGPEFAAYFGFGAKMLGARFCGGDSGDDIDIDEEDLELIVAFGVSPGLAQRRLALMPGVQSVSADPRNAFRTYLLDKYVTN